MMQTMLLLIFLTLAVGFIGWLLFLWAVKSGQYDDIEGPKYRMLDDEDDEVVNNPIEKTSGIRTSGKKNPVK